MKAIYFCGFTLFFFIIASPLSHATILEEYTRMDYFVYDLDFIEEFETKDNFADSQYRYYTYKGEFDGKLGFELGTSDSYQEPDFIDDGNYSDYRVDTKTGFVYDSNNEPIINYGKNAASILYCPNTFSLEIGDNLDPYSNFTVTGITDYEFKDTQLEVLEIQSTISNATMNYTVNGIVDRSMGFFINLRMESYQSFYINNNGVRELENYHFITTWKLKDYHIQKVHGELPISSDNPIIPDEFEEYPFPLPFYSVFIGLFFPVFFRSKKNKIKI